MSPSRPLGVAGRLAVTILEIDRIISRTITYGGVTLVLFAAFVGVNLALQSVLEPLIGGGSIAVAGSTLVVAALFNPVRIRLQHVVDRRFNRSRRDAELTVGRFAGRLRDQLDLEAITGELARTTATALEPAATSVWVRTRASAP